jgi:hypothetical protein
MVQEESETSFPENPDFFCLDDPVKAGFYF